MSNDIILHPTDATRVQPYLETHIGKLINPPDSMERVQALGEQVSEEFEVSIDFIIIIFGNCSIFAMIDSRGYLEGITT